MYYVIDHEWNRFKYVKDMCVYWGVSTTTYYKRQAECKKLGIKLDNKYLLTGKWYISKKKIR